MVSVGADCNSIDNNGQTSVHVGVLTNHLVCVEMLLQSGGVCDVRDAVRTTPLQYAVSGGVRDMVDVLVRYHADPSLLVS